MEEPRETRGRKPGINERMRQAKSPEERLWVAFLGVGVHEIDREAARLTVQKLGDYLSNGTADEPNELASLFKVDIYDVSVEGLAAFFLAKLLRDVATAIKKRDGTALRLLADAVGMMDSERKPDNSKTWLWLVQNLCPRKGNSLPLPPLMKPVTMAELMKLVPSEEDGKKVSRSTLKSMCEDLEITIAPDKKRRPKKSADE